MTDVNTVTDTTEEPKVKKPRKAKATKAKAKKVAAKGKAKKAKTKAKRATNGRLPLDEERKDTVAASLRIRAGTPRAKLVEKLASLGKGKMISADALAKHVGWERRVVQHFVMVRIPAKSANYKLGYKVTSDGEGNYGLETK